MNEVRVYGRLLRRANARIAQQCSTNGVNPREPILLVLATTGGPHRLAEESARWGELLAVGKGADTPGIIEVRAEAITSFARQHPERLIAKSGNGMPAPRDNKGDRTTAWADLGDPDTAKVAAAQ